MKKHIEEKKKINPVEVLLTTNVDKERNRAAKMLVDRCFERAFGKEFLDNNENEEVEEKDYVYHFSHDDPKG